MSSNISSSITLTLSNNNNSINFYLPSVINPCSVLCFSRDNISIDVFDYKAHVKIKVKTFHVSVEQLVLCVNKVRTLNDIFYILQPLYSKLRYSICDNLIQYFLNYNVSYIIYKCLALKINKQSLSLLLLIY